MENTITDVKDLRVRLDVILNALQQLPKNRNASLAFTSTEKSRMYMGKLLGVLGTEYPYEATKTATKASEIDEPTDKGEKVIILSGEEIKDLVGLRKMLNTELTNFLEVAFGAGETNGITLAKDASALTKFKMNSIVSEVYRGLCEGSMYLGLQLGEIKAKDGE